MSNTFVSISHLSIGTISIILILYMFKRVFTKKWTHIGYLSEIFFYPVKSCAVINIDDAECNLLGLRKGYFRDRTFMITDAKGNYKSGRDISTLVNIKPNINKNILTLSADNMSNLILNLNDLEMSTNIIQCKIWNDIMNVVDCGEKAAQWVSNVILDENIGLKLVYYPHKQSYRSIRKKFTVSDNVTKKDLGAFSDGSSYMLATDSSLDILNKRLENKNVTLNQFRPNFVIKGSKPHDEDNWRLIKIGSAVFEAVLPCTRCHFVNVDPKTGIKHGSNEPLKTLKAYRQVNNNALRKIVGDSPKMGIQLGLRSPGQIKIGDPVYVTYN